MKNLNPKEYKSFVNKLISDTNKADFIQNPLAKKFFEHYQNDDTEFKKAFNSNETYFFWWYIYWKIKYNENINLSWFGTARSGKTSAAASVAFKIGELENYPFPVDSSCVFQNQTQYLRFAPFAKENHTYIIDEQKHRHTQIGSYAEEEELNDINRICAKKCIHNLWLSPDFVNRGGEYALKTIALDRKLKLIKCLIMDLRNIEDGFFKTFGYTVIRHYDISVTEISPAQLKKIPDKKLNPYQLFRKNYEAKKDKGIEETIKRMSGERVIYRLQDSIKLSTNPIFLKCKNQMERLVLARAILPAGYVEDEIREIAKLAVSPKIAKETINLLRRRKIKEPEDIFKGI